MKAKILIIAAICLLVPVVAWSAAIPSFTPSEIKNGFKEPTRITIDIYSNVYVSDSLAQKFLIYDKSNNLLSPVITETVGKPLGIAVSGGKLYVGDDSDGSVKIFNITYNGANIPTSLVLAGSLGKGKGEFSMPNAVVVSSGGYIYVVDSTAHFVIDGNTGKTSFDYSAHHIKYYNSSGVFVNSFGTYGKDNEQFEFPVDLAIDDMPTEDYLKTLYVADNVLGTITYYYLNGTCKKETVSTCEKDSSTGECIYCKKIGGALMDTNNKFARLQGVSVDKLGRVYAVDAFQGEIKVFSSEGDYLTKVGTFGNGTCTIAQNTCLLKGGTWNGTTCIGISQFDCEANSGTWVADGINDQLDHPIDSVISASGGHAKLYVTSSNSNKLKIFTIDNYSLLQLSVGSLSFSAVVGDPTPASQNITLTSLDNPISWTASVGQSWLSINKNSGSTASTITAAVNISGMTAGSYSGNIAIYDNDSNTTTNVPVTLTLSAPTAINPTVMSVTPDALVFSGQVNGTQPATQSIAISNTGGGTLGWTATVNYQGAASQSWLGINKNSGSGNGNINVSVNTSGIGSGEHAGSIVITAPDTLCTPGTYIQCSCTTQANPKSSCSGTTVKTVNVVLNLKSTSGKIVVKSNIPDAKFTLTGTATYSGSGAEWTKTDALAGDYNVAFDAVSGMLAPDQQSGTLAVDGTLTFIGNYVPIKVLDSIIVGSGEKATVKIFNVTSDGSWTLDKNFAPFKANEGVRVAAGDVDGDGVDEIVSTLWDGSANRAWVVISKKDGGLVTSFLALPNEGRYGATVAVGDIDGDGLAEIVIGGGPGPMVPARVKIYKYKDGQISDTGINLLAFDGGYGVNVALGDTDGDGMLELITTPGPNPSASGDVKIWKIDSKGGAGKWSALLVNSFVGLNSSYGATVAAADLDGDGTAEIILGAGPGSDNDARVEVFSSSGKHYGLAFIAGDWRYGVNVAAGDILDEDGIAEIVVSPGHGSKNTGVMKVFDSAGNVVIDEVKVFETGYGASVAIGGKK